MTLNNQYSDYFEKLKEVVDSCESKYGDTTLEESISAMLIGAEKIAIGIDKGTLELNQVMAVAAMCMLVIKRSKEDLARWDVDNAN